MLYWVGGIRRCYDPEMWNFVRQFLKEATHEDNIQLDYVAWVWCSF